MLPAHLAHLSTEDQDLLRRALVEAVDGPYFPDWELHTLMGVERDEVGAVADSWPDPPTALGADALHTQELATNNALVNLIGYPHCCDDRLREHLGVGRDGLRALFQRWRHGTQLVGEGRR